MFCALVANAQQSKHNNYKDEIIGWKKIYNFESATKSVQVDDKIYSPQQITISGTLANWMQMSYLPKGVLGEVKKTVQPKAGLYNQYIKALPQAYGAIVYAYYFLKKDENGKWTNETTHADIWRIMANEIPNADFYGISFLSNEKEYYFTIPELPDADATRWKTLQENTSNHPVIKKYYNKILPDFGGASSAKLIILSKDNVFPFQQLTIGEVLNLTEKSIQAWFETEKKKIAEANQYPGNKNMYKDYEFHLNKAKEKTESSNIFLTQLKSKYKEKLDNPAFLFNGKFEISDLVNGYDIFSGNESSKISKNNPVYKIKPELIPLCKTNNPQWITILWTGGTLEDERYHHLNQSILQNFDFDYLHNYFFDKNKAANKSYQPLKTPQ